MRSLVLVLLAGSCVASSVAFAQSPGFTVLAAGSGASDVIPALGPNLSDFTGPVEFFLFGSGPEGGPAIAANGDLFFAAQTNTVVSNRNDGIFRHRAGANQALILDGTSATSNTGIPATPSFYLDFNPFNPPAINRSQPIPSDDGSILFYSFVGDDQFASQQAGLFRRSNAGVITPLALTGSDGPLGPGLGAGEVFTTGGLGIAHSRDGEGLYRTFVTNPQFQQREIIMTFSPDGTQRRVIALTGQPAPGSTGVHRSFVSTVPPSLVSSGGNQIARFRSDFQNNFDGGLLVANGASVLPFALSGTDGALGPGLGAGAIFNSSGGFAFVGGVGGSAFGATATTRVFLPDPGTSATYLTRFAPNTPPVLLAGSYGFSGGPLGPGLGLDVHFAGFSDAIINDQGLIAFGAGLIGANTNPGNDSGVFIVTQGSAVPVCIAREGDVNTPLSPPGLSGWRFASSLSSDLNLLQIASNAQGDVVFRAPVQSPTFQFRSGLFAWNQATGLRTVAVAGITSFQANIIGEVQTFTIGEFGEISFNGWSGGNDGRSTGLADDGTIYFQTGIQTTQPSFRSFPVMLRFGVTGPTCDGVDFNNDGSLFDPTDIDAFLSVFSEGPCIPANATCNDVDFNNDGSLFDPCDVDAFLIVFSEGPCTLCGQ
jgi:hypothetical protein